jgi:O-antigen/teichoic acid export membrane protein
MSALPRPQPGTTPLRRLPDEPAPHATGARPQPVASASAWTLSSMAVMSVLRLVSQAVLTHLCLPEHFAVVTLMRTFLTFVEMVSDMGIRNAVVSHPRGEERVFLGTAFSVQFVRGLGMWGLTCAVAWPVAAFYGAPILLPLMALAGLESVNNGLYAVRAYVAERHLKLAVPTLLDVLALLVSVGTSVVWAWHAPGPWALALGPLVGGCVRMLASHAIYRAERVPMAWDKPIARELFEYSRWIIGSTTVSFVAQNFHLLYLGKFLAKSVYGVYGSAWSLAAQASKPMTALANRVIIPHLAEAHRNSPEELEAALQRSTARFLPACVLVCVCAGLFAPAMFGLFYGDSFEEGGGMGRLFAVVVWFMILQHVPRCALLSLGVSRGVASMAFWNAGLTVVGIVGGYALQGGWLAGAIIGNALGNVAGCWVGWVALRESGLHVGRALVRYSLAFLGLLGAGVLASDELVRLAWLGSSTASLTVTAALCVPLAVWVWRSTISPMRARRARS